MAVSISNIPKNTNIYRFITSGKPGRCKLCSKYVEKMEFHHLSYSPEIGIKLCHACHHKTHFFPNRLNESEKLLLLIPKFGAENSRKMISGKMLGPHALAKLIAPSRSKHIHAAQKLEQIRLLKSQKVQDRKVFKEKALSKNTMVSQN